MSSSLTGNQPLAGVVSNQIGVLFTNYGKVDVVCTSLEFNNNSSADNIVLELYQPDDAVMTRVKRSVLNAGYTERDDSQRIVRVGESIAARASVNGVISWRVNLRAL